MQWMDAVLQEQYDTVAVLKQNEQKTIVHLRHKQLQKDLVLRTFHGSGEAYSRLLHISHPHVLRVFEVLEEQGACTVLEEYVAGSTLARRLETKLYSAKEACRVGRELCRALATIHAHGVVHRDVKPENVMLRPDGSAVLTDFDAARVVKPRQSADTEVLGTTGYAAPEQFGLAQSDGRTDIFAMGVLLNVMVTGDHPSHRKADGRLGRIVDRCVQTDPEKRYQTAEQLYRALGGHGKITDQQT